MNRDQAINELEHKLSAKGYVHPTQHRGPVTDAYAIIDVKDTNAIYQSSNKSVNPYASFTPKEDDDSSEPIKKVQKNDICPLCECNAMYACECEEFGDMMCKNGHVWYINMNGVMVKGDPHKFT